MVILSKFFFKNSKKYKKPSAETSPLLQKLFFAVKAGIAEAKIDTN